MACCLNPVCYNPAHPVGTKYCSNCGVPLVVLRNRYLPLKSLGGGGFGKTYLAEDIDKLNQKCVIKQFAPQIQGTNALRKATELFEQEARRLEQLGEHSQIPTLLAYFQEDSRLYLVQQFIDGQNLLTELAQQGTFSESKIRALLQDLLAILTIVHQQKVIHRDIKPENIIRRGSDGKLVLIDFGASKQINQTMVSQPGNNKGTSIGSFGYVPIEQMKAGEAYPASDLYGVGATCFHLISGIHPWELWQLEGYGWVANWRRHLNTPISPELGKILDNLLQQDYQTRYQSATAVLQDLQPPLIIAKPTEMSPPNISVTPRKSIPIYFFLPLILLPLSAGAIYLQTNANQAGNYHLQGIEKYEKQDLPGAIADYNQAINVNSKYAEAFYNRGEVRGDLGDSQNAIADLRQATELFTTQGKQAEAKRTQGLELYVSLDYQGAIAAYDEALRLNPQDFKTYKHRGDANYYLVNYQTAVADYSQAININANYAEAYNNRGTAYYNLGDYQAAIADFNQATKINPNYAYAYINRGLTRLALGEREAAIEDYNQAIKINPNFADAYNLRGNARAELGDRQAAIADYKQVIKISPNYALDYTNRGDAHYNLEDYQAAIEAYSQAININPNYALAHNGRGYARAALGNYQAAVEDYNQAIRINPNLVDAYNNRGDAHRFLGDRQTAIADYSQAIKINPNYVTAYNNRGFTRYELGNYQAAIEDYNQAIKINPQYAYAYNGRGASQYYLKNYPAALADYNQAIKFNSQLAVAYYNRGLVHNYLGNKQEAIADFRQAADLYKQQGQENNSQDALKQIQQIENPKN